jgi:hypothetical protein
VAPVPAREPADEEEAVARAGADLGR